MVKMSVAMKNRVSTVLSLFRVSFQFGFVPLILYLGFKKGAEEGMPELTIFSSEVWFDSIIKVRGQIFCNSNQWLPYRQRILFWQ